jgi:CheY-like chemotaxis protein
VPRKFPLVIVDEARNGREALDVVNREKVDIVLLDIRMPEMDGMEAARHIAGMETPPAIIFTTAFDSYALKAFEVNAIDYSVEADPRRAPAGGTRQDARLAAGLAPGADAAANQPRRHLSVHERGKIHLVPLADVLYLRAELKYVTVRTAAREFLVEESPHQPRAGVRGRLRAHPPQLPGRARGDRRLRAQLGGERVGLGGRDQGDGREAAGEPQAAARGEVVQVNKWGQSRITPIRRMASAWPQLA